MEKKENKNFLKDQIITYLGNKRSLINHIEEEMVIIKKKLKKERLYSLDLFSGSGVVARMMKMHSFKLVANDLEEYSKIINECYLANKSDFDTDRFNFWKEKIEEKIEEKDYTEGIISKKYAPKNDKKIEIGERCFYTTENALKIDTIRSFVDQVDDNLKKFFLAPLLYQASVKTNTAGIFKGFYKDSKTGIGKFGGNGEYALNRIKGGINVIKPVLSNFEADVKIMQEDANKLVKEVKGFDVVYIDPPYNQHPYGSNYFMLNLIVKNKLKSKISPISGIPEDWNRSDYNVASRALKSFGELLGNIDSKYIIVSYNSEGIIPIDDLKFELKKHGELTTKEIVYNTYRGSRNLSERSLYVNEYLFIVKIKRGRFYESIGFTEK